MKNIKVVMSDKAIVDQLCSILEPLSYQISVIPVSHRIADEDFEETELIVFDPNIGDIGLISGCIDTLKSRNATSRIPIVLMSSAENDDSIIEGLNAGANDFILVPVSTENLTRRLKALLSK